MATKSRKAFSADLKARVALEAVRGQKTVNEIGQEFGVHPTQVGLWKKELQEQAILVFDVKRGQKSIKNNATEDRLYTEIGRLKMDLDWLKKSLGSVCRHTVSVD